MNSRSRLAALKAAARLKARYRTQHPQSTKEPAPTVLELQHTQQLNAQRREALERSEQIHKAVRGVGDQLYDAHAYKAILKGQSGHQIIEIELTGVGADELKRHLRAIAEGAPIYSSQAKNNSYCFYRGGVIDRIFIDW